ncbi:1-acyl-sn-glycerol-3-phosphate acyltransferase [Roseivirga sp. E12]|uniref:lysophospholipid acyltransferase family protein n=1 Tax=Roseivirga sp. E12 TaxID=2819237 RepID=UPI001ABC3E57|nr:lysophospholipid acyltransferase family protein [Roseivirga sp. E12]MBO3700001.1 1-acyl-sn-glycerol-3-phosphate acyltransferase [Roseivirga sp. E12]
MKRRLLLIYSVYGLIVFALVFIILLPFFLLAIFIKPLEKMAATLNYIWARVFFFFLFLNRTKITFDQKLDRKQRYIFCANHTSYLDIPTIGLIGHNFKFIGKASLKKVPLWGYMYNKLHILVDRKSMRSKHNTWLNAKEAIARGFGIVFFPEGGILSKEPPKMVAFKEGSFRIAVEEQIPIVPITIPYNHILLPDVMPLTMHPGKVRVHVHAPIWPEGQSDEAVKALKQKVRSTMEAQMDKFYNDEG